MTDRTAAADRRCLRAAAEDGPLHRSRAGYLTQSGSRIRPGTVLRLEKRGLLAILHGRMAVITAAGRADLAAPAAARETAT